MEIIATISGLLALAGVLFIWFRVNHPAKPEIDSQLVTTLTALSTAQAELSGRLTQLSESGAAQQAALSTALNERLDAIGKRVGDSLTETADKNAQSMTELQNRLAVIDAAQRNLTELSSQVVSLQDILSNKQARGAFGEIQLADIVRDRLPPSAYRFQEVLSNGKRADCLILLPNPPGAIVIDSKFPLEAYRALRETQDDATRKKAASAFNTDVRKHIDDIAGRYIIPGETAEMAMMFLPSEAVYAELHANFQNIIDYSNRVRVSIVSPSTMWANLNTMRAILKDVRMREQAGVIQKEVMKLAGDVNRLGKRTANLRKHFSNMIDDVEEIETSTKKIVTGMERIEEVQISDDGASVEELPIGSATARILPPE